MVLSGLVRICVVIVIFYSEIVYSLSDFTEGFLFYCFTPVSVVRSPVLVIFMFMRFYLRSFFDNVLPLLFYHYRFFFSYCRSWRSTEALRFSLFVLSYFCQYFHLRFVLKYFNHSSGICFFCSQIFLSLFCDWFRWRLQMPSYLSYLCL